MKKEKMYDFGQFGKFSHSTLKENKILMNFYEARDGVHYPEYDSLLCSQDKRDRLLRKRYELLEEKIKKTDAMRDLYFKIKDIESIAKQIDLFDEERENMILTIKKIRGLK